jgi:hypothetical protein
MDKNLNAAIGDLVDNLNLSDYAPPPKDRFAVTTWLPLEYEQKHEAIKRRSSRRDLANLMRQVFMMVLDKAYDRVEQDQNKAS